MKVFGLAAAWASILAALVVSAAVTPESHTHPCPSGGSCAIGYECPSYASPTGPCVPARASDYE